MRKKVLAIALVFIMLFSLITLSGCFGKDYSSDIAALQKEINKLKEEGSSNADYIKDLQDKINKLNEELSNAPNADYIKDLQDKINKLNEELSNAPNADYIKDLQDQLDNITQAITTSYDYNPDQEITVRFNGIDYYRFKITRELHNRYIPDTLCMTNQIHFCGYLTFTNLYYDTINISTIEKLFDIRNENFEGINGLQFKYNAQQKQEKIKNNETKTMPFNINYSNKFMKKTIFTMKTYAIVNDYINAIDYTIPLAVIPNFYTMTEDLESIPYD